MTVSFFLLVCLWACFSSLWVLSPVEADATIALPRRLISSTYFRSAKKLRVCKALHVPKLQFGQLLEPAYAQTPRIYNVPSLISGRGISPNTGRYYPWDKACHASCPPSICQNVQQTSHCPISFNKHLFRQCKASKDWSTFF